MIKFVDVKDEPIHKELFEDEYIRLYAATIPSGSHTLYHRHTVDTIYAVVQGTEIAGDSNRYPMNFPKSFSLFSKVRFGIRNLLTGSVRMPNGFFFCLPHKNNPIIHRASSSYKNTKNMIMMGVEIKGKLNHNKLINLNKKFYKMDYEGKEFLVYRLKLKPDQSTDFNNCNYAALTIPFNNAACICIKNLNSSLSTSIELGYGSFHWHDCTVNESISNVSNKNFEAITIIFK